MHGHLIANAGIRQVRAVTRADAAADAADAAVKRIWRNVLILLKDRPFAIYNHAVTLFRHLLPEVRHATHASLASIGRWGWRSAVANLKRAVPQAWLQVAATRRMASLNRGGQWPLREDVGTPFSLVDLLDPFRSGEALDLDAVLFPAPSEDWLDRVIRSSGWEKRLGHSTSLAAPETMANLLVRGFADGKSQQEVARDLLPAVEGVRTSARRVARTAGMHVANAAQWHADQQLGDICIGHQIHATLDAHTRPEHAARSGTVYYKKPKPGQLGYEQMPHPPHEADGSLAWNCRCFTSAILSDPGEEVRANLDALPDATPEHVIYSDWFATASRRERITAVGARRHAINPAAGWEAFLDDTATRLLTVDELESETVPQRRERVQKVRAALQHRREMLVQTRRYGSIQSTG